MLTKEEIYVKLGYRGEYTKEVKRKFRLLCKHYHPDVNHGNGETMKLLNQVKEEIEAAEEKREVKHTNRNFSSSPPEETFTQPDFSAKTEQEDIFQLIPKEKLEKKIAELEEILKEMLITLTSKNKKIYQIYQEYNHLLDKIERSKVEIDLLKTSSTKYSNYLFLLFGISIGIFFFLLFFVFILGIMYGYFQSYFFWLILIVFLGLNVVTLYFLVQTDIKRRKIDAKISSQYAKKNEQMIKSFQIQDEIIKQEEDYRNLKTKYQKTANDRQLYYYEISKRQNKVPQKSKMKKYKL